MGQHYKKILLDSEGKINRALDLQVLEPASEFYGGFRDPDGLVEPKYAIYVVSEMIACLLNRDSRFYNSPVIYESVMTGLEYIAGGQRENGFFDLINCNFYSGPDTAFCLIPFLRIFIYLKRLSSENGTVPAEREIITTLRPTIKSILLKGGQAVLKGGFHTPNHRWAMASVLMMLYRLTSDRAYEEGAAEFLLEGCDCNEDGEYAERSAGGYNKVNNDAMIMLAMASGDDSWFEPVKRNLSMMLTYMEPDGSIFTNNSTRQDRGVKVYPVGYYMEYLYMGVKFGNDSFLKAAAYIMKLAAEKGLGIHDCLIEFMLMPELKKYGKDVGSVPQSYCRHYKDSGIVRLRRDFYSCSILKGSPAFLYFQNGALTVSMKIGVGFCEHRSFVGEYIEDLEHSGNKEHANGYVLTQKMQGWYYLPFKEPQESTDWWKMDHSKREKLYGPDLSFTVTVTEAEHGIDVHVAANGIDRSPIRIELAFDGGGRAESEGFITSAVPGGSIVARKGTVTVSKGRDAITVGPGFGRHNYVAGKFGSQERSKDCFTVYFTDFSCFEHKISLRAVPSDY